MEVNEAEESENNIIALASPVLCSDRRESQHDLLIPEGHTPRGVEGNVGATKISMSLWKAPSGKSNLIR